jgi:hypothetical protein
MSIPGFERNHKKNRCPVSGHASKAQKLEGGECWIISLIPSGLESAAQSSAALLTLPKNNTLKKAS